MTSYRVKSRRPIADLFRLTAHAAVRWCVNHGVHPDTVSYASVVAALAAALCFWQAAPRPVLLLPGVLFCYLRLWLNMLDGMVALASKQASPRGEIVNDLPDRVSDVLIFVGVAHSGLCHPASAYWVALLAVLTAYVGVSGQAVGAQREFSGVMSKPLRMVALHLGAWITWGALAWNGAVPRLAGLTVLDATHLLIIAGCLWTMQVRLRRIFRALETHRA